MGGYTRAISGQQLGKKSSSSKEHESNNGTAREMVFSVVRAAAVA
jgi:hypothetical protein